MQLQKDPTSILDTDVGMVTLDNAWHSTNVSGAMYVIEDGISMMDKEKHFKNLKEFLSFLPS